MNSKVLVITGPTATGKTKLGLQLAERLNGELVSADSRQVYKGMDIGTGKDIGVGKKNVGNRNVYTIKSKEFILDSYIVNNIPMWMYDVVLPNEEFSVSHFMALAKCIIDDIHYRGKLPIIVGGTGLYIKSILERFETIDVPKNDMLRKELETRSVYELQQILKDMSVEALEQMNNSDKNNPRRLIRKIEIAHSTHIPVSNTHNNSSYDSFMIGLTVSTANLVEKIKTRVSKRVAEGIIQEINTLLQQGYSWDLPSMNTFGYKEWKDFIQNPSEDAKQKAIEAWINDEIHYTKKQMTWFKKQSNIHWYNSDDSELLQKTVEGIEVWYT